MAVPFLKSVAAYIHENYKDNAEKLCIVLPNKRGALFLKHHLAATFGKTLWLPAIISAEELVTGLSGLSVIEEIDLVCHLFESYRSCYGANAEPFDSFAKWGQLILQDFNEIDRYLADPAQLYENLRDIKEIENWSLGAEVLTQHQTSYLQFMNSLGNIYKHFSAFLVSRGWAYQGLAYRVAVDKFESSAYPSQFHKFIFCGFNALNAAELKIFNGFYLQKKADLLWDADRYYLDDPNQEAGLFLRKNFEHFGLNDPQFIADDFKNTKHIRVISVPKQIGQAQVVKQRLQQLISEGVPLDRVAVVLANEKLLWPVLQQLPAAVEHVNITMEYPLRYSSTYGLVDLLLQLQYSFTKQHKTVKTIYHKDLTALLRQPLFRTYLKAKALRADLTGIINSLTTRNLAFLSPKVLKELFGEDFAPLQELMQPAASVAELCNIIIGLLQTLVSYFYGQAGSNQAALELEYLQVILRNFNRLTEIISKYAHFNDLQSFKQLYTQVVGNATAPFIGEPLRGLQIMGVLETRTLDFDHLVIVNVNEGILPSGKTINSFIPNDLKRAFGLPLYLEKDAIYAYHFYRLLQRAGDITITYDSETDTFGKGEKSRFLTQLELEVKKYNPGIRITEELALSPGVGETQQNVISIQKNETVLASIIKKASGNEKFEALSPSGLITFKECPLRFYFRYGVHLKETREVEESAEANTFGSILHLSLERLYTAFTGRPVSAAELKEQLAQVDAVVNQSFIEFFDKHQPSGKSLLQEEVIKVYVRKLLKNDVRFIEQLALRKALLTISGLEQEYSASLDLSIDSKASTVYLRGKIDRIDSCDGITRIIDYKSSVKDSDKFVFEGFEKLFLDKNYNKQLQLMIYAWLLFKNNVAAPEKIRPCIIPFKAFSEEPRYLLQAPKKPLVFTTELMNDFENELRRFIESIFDTAIPFGQTSDEEIHQYCPYNTICNFAV